MFRSVSSIVSLCICFCATSTTFADVERHVWTISLQTDDDLAYEASGVLAVPYFNPEAGELTSVALRRGPDVGEVCAKVGNLTDTPQTATFRRNRRMVFDGPIDSVSNGSSGTSSVIPVGGTRIYCRDGGGYGVARRTRADEFIGTGIFDLSYLVTITHTVDDPDSFDLTFLSCACPIEMEVSVEYCYWPGCAGDTDEDGDVDVVDLLNVLSAWGSCEECSGDRTCDGEVDVSDLLVVLNGWSGCGE